MSEERKIYLSQGVPTCLKAFKNRRCANSFDDGYECPTPEEIKALRNLMGWSQNDVARIVGVNFNPSKGSTTIRKWETASDKPEHRDIPYSAWRLMLLYAGVVSLED